MTASQIGARARTTHPLAWVPSAYIAEGIPFALVIWVAGTMLKDFGYGDGEITLATASIGLAWSLKPLWAAFLELWKTKKFFVLASEAVMAALLVAIAACVRVGARFELVIAGLWLLAFASATQDICVDGVYISSLDRAQKAAWIGVQGMAWNLGRIVATALLVWIAGSLQADHAFSAREAWPLALLAGAASMASLALHHFFFLPQGSISERPRRAREVVATFVDTLRAFLGKKRIGAMLLFVFLYRSGEGFLLVEAPLFMQAPHAAGGLGLSLKEKGFIDGTISTTVSIIGGIAGGAFIARFGLKRTLVFMALCMNVPHVCFVILSQLAGARAAPELSTVAALVTLEKFGYSFGFIANMLYMMEQIAPGKYQMTHYAFCTALMNLVLIPTQMASGPLAEVLGYKHFFLFVLVASIPSVIAAWQAPFGATEGTTEQQEDRKTERV